MRVAAAQYDLVRARQWSDYAERLSQWVAAAGEAGAHLAVFPEYAGLELLGVASGARRMTPRTSYSALQPWIPDVLALHRHLAHQHGVTIVAGSLPVASGVGGFVNRVHVVAPDGTVVAQDKRQLTRVEHATEVMVAGSRLRLVALGNVRVGVLLCYDAQFPLLGRALAQAGADVLLSPSCTHAATGFNRVRLGCRSRALENQCYSVQAPLVGRADWFALVRENTGRAGVFAPPDTGFPDDGVVAESANDGPGWLFSDLDLGAVRSLRDHGEVGNYNDWDSQYPTASAAVETVTLGADASAGG